MFIVDWEIITRIKKVNGIHSHERRTGESLNAFINCLNVTVNLVNIRKRMYKNKK